MNRIGQARVQSSMWLTLLLATGLAQTPPLRAAQAPEPVKVAPVSDIFSGNITELTPDFITVERRVSGKDPETRKFLRDSQTKIEGVLKLRARVTVRFQADSPSGLSGEEPVPALHIIVR
jgi:hypothetical protein